MVNKLRLAVIGSRDFNDYATLEYILNTIKESELSFTSIVSGGAGGADELAEQYADKHNIEKDIYYPDWKQYGKAAGFVRNTTIWDNADYGVAFWDGKSKGTAHSFKIAKKQKKRLFVYNYTEDDFYEVPC